MSYSIKINSNHCFRKNEEQINNNINLRSKGKFTNLTQEGRSVRLNTKIGLASY